MWISTTQVDDFERRLCVYTQYVYMSQMNPKKILYNTTFSVQLPYIAGYSL